MFKALMNMEQAHEHFTSILLLLLQFHLLLCNSFLTFKIGFHDCRLHESNCKTNCEEHVRPQISRILVNN